MPRHASLVSERSASPETSTCSTGCRRSPAPSHRPGHRPRACRVRAAAAPSPRFASRSGPPRPAPCPAPGTSTSPPAGRAPGRRRRARGRRCEMTSGPDPLVEHRAAGLEREAALAVADVEDDAALAWRPAPRRGCCGSPSIGALGQGRKQWVSTSPGRSASSTSFWLGGALSICAITGSPSRSATSSARCSGAMPDMPPAACADARLDADDEVAVGLGRRQAFARVRPAACRRIRRP